MFYLAVTASELANFRDLSQKTAFMACHFCPSSPGLSNIPGKLPPGSLLLLDDSIPPAGHDSARVIAQLGQVTRALDCAGIYLDFQRPGYPLLEEIAAMAEKLPCPVAVSKLYSGGNRLPVVLPSPPLDQSLAAYIAPWQAREIWLELTLDAKRLTLTHKGWEESPLLQIPEQGFSEDKLFCHYTVQTQKNAAIFSLWRTPEDIFALHRKAQELGIAHTIAAWEDLRPGRKGN